MEDRIPSPCTFAGQQALAKTLNGALYTQTADPDGLGVTYEFSDGHTAVRKTFRFQKNSYLVQVSSEVTAGGQPVPSMIEWRGGFGDLTLANPRPDSQTTLYFDVASNKLVEQTATHRQERPGHQQRRFLVCRHRGRLLRRGIPAGGQRHHAGDHVLRYHPHAAQRKAGARLPARPFPTAR